MGAKSLNKRGKTALISAVVVFVTLALYGCAGGKKLYQPLSFPIKMGLKRDFTEKLKVGDTERAYRVHLPFGYDGKTSLPAVLAFHGWGGTGRGMERLTEFNEVADREGFVVVYPYGLKRSWNDGRPEYPSRLADDVGFIRDLIEKLAGVFGIDKRRVYAAGISNGGLFAFRLACEMPERIAAIASVSATMGEYISRHSRPSLPVPVLLMVQTDDPFMPWGGGVIRSPGRRRERVLSVSETIDFWVKHNGCADSPRSDYLPDKDPHDGTRVRRETYSGGLGGTEVEVYIIEGGGHTWPGGWQYLREEIIGTTSRDIEASQVIWEFFRRHARAGV